jgi:hypothetical protein
MTEREYNHLPSEVLRTILDIRASCKELDPDFKPYAIDQGIIIVDLNGSGSKDIMLDAKNVCNRVMAGANCSNHGCDLKIWKQISRFSWKKSFDEHLYRKFISISEKNRFRMMAVSIYAADPRCKPDPKKYYTAGQSCDALVYYKNNRWTWKKI